MIEQLSKILNKQFQKKISILVDDKEIKTGKFLLYRDSIHNNNFYIEFHIKRDKKLDMLKIPYPFKYEEHDSDNLIFFDYRIQTLCRNDKDLIKKIEKYADNTFQTPLNRFYNKIVELKFE